MNVARLIAVRTHDCKQIETTNDRGDSAPARAKLPHIALFNSYYSLILFSDTLAAQLHTSN